MDPAFFLIVLTEVWKESIQTLALSQYGRVNFINSVRYGERLIDGRSAFDATGGKITIGKL